jgi:hypothetical protein
VELYHLTSLLVANEISNSQQMWSKDGHRAANFFCSPIPTSEVDSGKDEVSMVFEWTGQEDHILDTARPLPENCLYHVYLQDKDGTAQPDRRTYWVSRLYPGTTHGLKVTGLLIHKELSDIEMTQVTCLNQKINEGIEITVPS